MSRGQAALEYWLTYAWVILVVMLVIGVLNYMGILDVYSLMPNVCLAKAGFRCEDFQINTDGTATVIMRNAQAQPLYDFGVVLNGVPGICPPYPEWADSQVLECNFQDLDQKTEGSPF